MACESCEERQRKIKDLYEKQKERLQMCLRKLRSKDTGSKQQADRADRNADTDQQ